ncbi:nucleotidyltransferase family protein [Uliginosibacterium sp. H3]|uniref:Nucleotidyltransferase family protein n=1 Tax=Uliginosibacterium silvisoli TaxID=3114758 RepID=A0ABU6K211_9RHOO|nr:nucleotidyltransferase family protein [Uliginosibacterium sp. H3]
MILAAGRGERMRPLTDHAPKPLLPVGGKPLIVWHIERLAAAGFNEIVINHAHLGHMLEETLGNGRMWNINLRYSPEGEALETAGGIAKALPLLGPAPFLVVNGDVWCDIDFERFVARGIVGITQGAHVHVALVSNPAHHPAGDFNFLPPQPPSSIGQLSAEPGGTRLTFSGIGVYRAEFFNGITPGEKARLAPLLQTAITGKHVTGEHFNGRWIDVGTPERLAELDTQLKAMTALQPR